MKYLFELRKAEQGHCWRWKARSSVWPSNKVAEHQMEISRLIAPQGSSDIQIKDHENIDLLHWLNMESVSGLSFLTGQLTRSFIFRFRQSEIDFLWGQNCSWKEHLTSWKLALAHSGSRQGFFGEKIDCDSRIVLIFNRSRSVWFLPFPYHEESSHVITCRNCRIYTEGYDERSK